MTQIHVAMLGARMHYAVPRIFDELGLLGRFYTDSYIGNKYWLEKILQTTTRVASHPVLTKWLGRRAAITADKVISYELLGINSWWRWRRVGSIGAARRMYAEINRNFNGKVVASGLQGADVIYACNTAALEIFRHAKQRGILCILEQTIAPLMLYQQLLVEEAAIWPDWQRNLLDLTDAPKITAEREQQEWTLADFIIGGSGFVKSELINCGVMPEKCRVVPYGVDITKAVCAAKEDSGGKLRVLFAGEVGLRKGAPYLLQALSMLGSDSIEAKFAGHIPITYEKLKPFESVAHFLGPVPRLRMGELFAWADVFVLPSLFEGSATVTYEALAHGVPVITTENTGSMVRDGIDGHIVPIRDPEAIAVALNHYVANPRHLQDQRAAAIAGREAVSLEAYKGRLAAMVADIAL